MDDLISRRKAFEYFVTLWECIGTIMDRDEWEDVCMTTANEIPSAQPEPCEDTVSRQRLLSDLKELTAAWEKYPVMTEQIKGVETAIGYVEAIPAAQPKRKKGKWITQEFGSWAKCSECHELYDIPIANSNYCPNCGADMRGE